MNYLKKLSQEFLLEISSPTQIMLLMEDMDMVDIRDDVDSKAWQHMEKLYESARSI